MSRTYRNRNTVPHGFVVRDDGCVYSEKHPSKDKEWEEYVRWCEDHREAGVFPPPPHPDLTPRRFRTRKQSKERKAFRKAHQRRYRARVRDRMDHEDWENIPKFRKTCGWLSW